MDRYGEIRYAVDGAIATVSLHRPEPDAFEGVTSFLQRRPPNFPGAVPADLPDYLPWLPK